MPALTRTLLGLLLLSGCLDPSRLNTSCGWTGDPAGSALNLGIAADRRHLVNDTRIAGENATRYRDSVQAHYGFGAAGTLDVECLERLYATIGAQHGVRRADIDAAAGRRDVLLDVALVYLPIGVVFFFIARRIARRLYRRMPSVGERWTTVVGVVWMGLGASGVATAVAYLHSWNVDTIRLRDFHMSFRGAYLPIGRHPGLAFLAAFTVFGAAAVREYLISPERRVRVDATAKES